jgi:hypothetical protein
MARLLALPLIIDSAHPTARKILELAAEQAIAALDELDGDPDLEDTDEDRCEFEDVQPNNASPYEDEDCEPDADGEPSLGSVEVGMAEGVDWNGRRFRERVGIDQTRWGNGSTTDAEGDEADKESSIGWTAAINQSGPNWQGDSHSGDREHDTADYEPDSDYEPEETDHSHGELRCRPPQEAKHEPFVLPGPDGNLWRFEPVLPLASKPEGGK